MTVEARRIRLLAPAKVNLGLYVTARREDGYHQIDSLMAKLDLHDVVTATTSPSGIRLTVEGANLPSGPDNLAYRAARCYLEAHSGAGGVVLHLRKKIPIAAGLGGGSSDAAAALRACEHLYPGAVDLASLAADLGSDVPFFLTNLPAARARGRGEVLEAAEVGSRWLVLVNPGVMVRATEAYAGLVDFTGPLPLSAILEHLTRGDEPGYLNALQPGVLLLRPVVREVIEELRATDLVGVLMSGSGPTCFGIAENRRHAGEVAATLQRRHPRWWVRSSALAWADE